MNFIKKNSPKQILKNFENFDYSNYLNMDSNKPESSISNDFAKNFIKKNQNFQNRFVTKMKLFWILQFLCYLIFITILAGYIAGMIILSDRFHIIIAAIFIAPGVLFLLFIQVFFSTVILFDIILNKITNRNENFKTFFTLFNENQFRNFDQNNGPHEFQIILFLDGVWNWKSMMKNLTNIRAKANSFNNNRPNLIPCMYLITNLLLYYFENSEKTISKK